MEARKNVPLSLFSLETLWFALRTLSVLVREKAKRISTSTGIYLGIDKIVYPEVSPLTAEEEKEMAEIDIPVL